MGEPINAVANQVVGATKSASQVVTDRAAPVVRAQTADRPHEAFIGLALAVISFLPFLTLLVLPALFFASKAKRQINASPVPLRGRDMVRFTRMLVIVSVLIPVGFLVVDVMAFGASLSGLMNQISSTLDFAGGNNG